MSSSLYICYPAVLWRCLGGRKGIWPVKNWVVGCWRGCLGWGADLHIAQQMPLPLTISCSSKSRLVLTFLVLPFWYLLTHVVLDKFSRAFSYLQPEDIGGRCSAPAICQSLTSADPTTCHLLLFSIVVKKLHSIQCRRKTMTWRCKNINRVAHFWILSAGTFLDQHLIMIRLWELATLQTRPTTDTMACCAAVPSLLLAVDANNCHW